MNSARRRTWIIASAVGMVSLASISRARGATQYWDVNGAAGGAGDVPSGTWDATTPFWSSDSSGASATEPWVSGNSAVFTAGSDFLPGFNVTLSGTQTISDILFEEGQARISGGSLLLTTGGISATGNILNVRANIQSPIEGSAGLTKSGTGVVMLSAVNTYTGPTTINDGRINLGMNDALPDATVLTINAAGSLSMGAFSDGVAGMVLEGGSIGITSGVGVLSAGSFAVHSGVISGHLGGSGALTKSGSGSVTLAGTSAYSGGTFISAGTLICAQANVLPTNGDVTISGGTLNVLAPQAIGTLILDGGGLGGSAAFTPSSIELRSGSIGGNLAGSAPVIKTTSGSVFLSSANTYTGPTTISQGTVWMTHASALGATGAGTTIAAGATLGLGSNITTSEPLTINGTGVEGRGAIRSNAAATLLGLITLGSDATINNEGFSITGLLTIKGGINTAGHNLTFGGPYSGDYRITTDGISGSGGVIIGKDANVYLEAPSTYAGATTVNGTLRLANGFSTAGGAITVGSGAAIIGVGTIAREIINNGTVSGLGPPDTFLTLAAPVSGSGAFTGNITIADVLSPGSSPAAITMDNVHFDPTAYLTIEIGGLTPGTEHDAITFTTGATFDGTLNLQLINGFEPALGDTFDLFNGPLTGSFDTILFPALGPGRTWDASNLYTTGSLAVVVPEPLTPLISLPLLGLIARRTKRTKCRW